MRILIIDPDSGGGIFQASLYLHDYLNLFHQADIFIGFDIPKIKSYLKDYDLMIVHDKPIDVSSFDIKTAYFVPSYFPYSFDESFEKLRTYDYYISPVNESYNNHIKWTFNIPIPKITVPFESKKDALYIGRVNEWKIDFSFLRPFLIKYRLDIIGEITNPVFHSLIKEAFDIRHKDSMPHKECLDEMQYYRYFILASNTDIFCLSALEAIYRGCYPLIKSRSFEYPWMVEETFRTNDPVYFLNSFEEFTELPVEEIKSLTITHRRKVIERMEELSNIEVFNQIFA